MKLNEPSRKWQERQHHLVVHANATAFAELCETALPHLAQFLHLQFPQFEDSLHQMTAIDVLLAYHAQPDKYDPAKLSLFAYLRMAARRDFLNAIDKRQRYNRRLLNINDPGTQYLMPHQQSLEESFLVDEWLYQYTALTQEEFIEALNATLDEQDQKIFSLMLDGVRETSAYADVMGLLLESKQTQQREVKRAKDRVIKKLQRFGANVKGSI
ncbi:MAG: hypothetical protein KC441_07645 [Anaerolineales bacterium]|nr:hypothetical protein [Anaerolineales bacterium]